LASSLVSIMSAQFNILSNALTQNGYRLTPSRAIIIETLVKSGGHITPDDLALQVQEIAPRVGRMTVYRTLDLLTELGLTRPIFQGTGAAHYILMVGGNHHHLICTRCQSVIEFDKCTADELVKQLAQQFDFLVRSHLLEVHGLCQTCHA
jgi:Fur family transcriptional regulator, ferric uptake regulator